MYDARLYEIKEHIIVINTVILKEVERKYALPYEKKGFFQEYVKSKKEKNEEFYTELI